MENSAIVILLKELIMEHNRVSLPCLGSFISEYSPATISDGKIYPPSKTVVFHQNEIWNDEKLENRIMQVNNVSIGVAKEELAFWIDNICVLLATGEEVSLSGLGRLYVSGQSKLMFEQESENLLMESFALTPVNIPSVVPAAKDALYVDKEKKWKKDKRGNNKGLMTGILIIAVFVGIAIVAIFNYILTDNRRYRTQPSEMPTQTPADSPENGEYFTPKYGIVLSLFETLREARDFSRKIPETSVYFIDSDIPYAVIFSYPSANSADSAIDSLRKNHPYAYIIKLK
jgi:hypothetical protein